jgi:chromatin segregation and condensation protein Rec8/ScpA/Scc1 (kleisin family)
LCQDISNVNGEADGNLPKRNRYELQRKSLKLADYNVLCRVLNAREDALNDTYDDGEADSLESSDEETSSSEESSSTEDATESRNKQNNARGA